MNLKEDCFYLSNISVIRVDPDASHILQHFIWISIYCRFFKYVKGEFDSTYWVILHAFLSSADFFFFKSTFPKNSFRNIIRVSNSLDPDQAQHFVGPDLGPNCLKNLSADNTRR